MIHSDDEPSQAIPAVHDLLTYDFQLPAELIAQAPLNPRDSSKLLVVDRKKGTWEHRHFRDLPEYLNSDDLIVANNTQVLRARLLGNRIKDPASEPTATETPLGGKVEFFLLEELRPRVWEGLFQASAKAVPGLKFWIPTPDGRGVQGTLIQGYQGTVSEGGAGTVVAEFDRDPLEAGAGEVPLPPYIQRTASKTDEKDYQTVYAKSLGSAAAPTAGLHFTDRVMADLRSRGVGWREITLHVGLGTFRPVKVRDIRQHLMHEERYEISPEVAKTVTDWKRAGKRVLGVGTTTIRTLESSFADSSLKVGPGRTKLFLKPGEARFQVVDRILTNFHLPQSTLLVLVCAFAGTELTLAAYEEAIRHRYRFFSYGDAMLIL